MIDNRRVSVLLPEGKSVLGSAPECGLRLDHPTVSRRHAEVEVADDGALVRDLRSSNSIWIGRLSVADPLSASRAGTSFELDRDSEMVG